MKKNFKTAAFFTVLSFMAIGCQKETEIDLVSGIQQTMQVQSNCMPAEMSKIDPVVPVISTVTFSPYYVFGNILALKAVEPSRYDDMEIVIDCYE